MDVARSNLSSLYYDFGVSEFAWKAVLAPFFALIFILAIYYFGKICGYRRTAIVAVELIALTLVVNLIVKILDTWAWAGFESKWSFFKPVFGFIAPVIPINIIVFSIFAVLLAYFSKNEVT